MMIFVLWKVGFSIGRLNYFSNEYFITVIFLWNIHLHMYSVSHVVDFGSQQFEIQLFALPPPFFVLHRAAVMKHLFLYFKYFFKIQSNNIIQQCPPCHSFADSYIECDCTVYFLNFIWAFSTLPRGASVRLGEACFFWSSYLSCSVSLYFILTV